MKIVVKEKGLKPYSVINGLCRPGLEIDKTLDIKFDFEDKNGIHQVVIEFTEFETKKIYRLLKKSFSGIEE